MLTPDEFQAISRMTSPVFLSDGDHAVLAHYRDWWQVLSAAGFI
jgi:hypothetical protein